MRGWWRRLAPYEDYLVPYRRRPPADRFNRDVRSRVISSETNRGQRSSSLASIRILRYLLPLQAFDDDELRGGGLTAQSLERGILRRVVPLAQAPHALELEDDQALGVPL